MSENEPLQRIVMVAPLLPGKREAYVRFVQELLGQRREAYERSRQDLGITREQFWLLETAGQPVAVVALTAQGRAPMETLSAALYALLAGRRPFDRWLRRRLQELHGLEFHPELQHRRPALLSELIAEWTAPAFPNGRQKEPADSEKGDDQHEA